MRSPAARIAIGAATLVAVVVLFIVFAGGDDGGDNKSATATTPTQAQTTPTTETTPDKQVAADEQITVRNGKPVGGVKKLSYESGDRIRFVVTSDVADEVHVHGYDIARDVPAGGSVRFGFPAKLEGIFEVELEGRAEQVAELRVSP